jgi:hypothetical protein
MVEQLSGEEIEKRYRSANEGVARSQWQIIWLLEAATGESWTWIRTLGRRYNRQGAEGIGEQRHQNPGRAGALSVQDDQELRETFEAAQERGENWSWPQVVAWMSERLGKQGYKQREWLSQA